MKQLTSQNLFTLSERVELMGATSPVVTNKYLFIALWFGAPSKPKCKNIKQIKMTPDGQSMHEP